MKPILIDTGFVVALLDRGERYHKICSNIINHLNAPLVTCEAVITETCYLMRDIPGAPQAVLINIETGIFNIPFQIRNLAKRVKELMSRYKAVPMDFADACLVCLAEDLETNKILTLDSDFDIYRWDRNNCFEILINLFKK